MKVFYLLILTGLLFSLNVGAQKKANKPTPFAREFRSEGDTLRYRIIYPEGYDKEGKEKYPLVFFLHGENENGSDNTTQMRCGGSIFMNAEMRHFFPAIVIFPQCPKGEKWAEYDMNEEYVKTPIYTENDSVPQYKTDTTYKFSISPEPNSTRYGDLLAKLVKRYKKNKTVDTDRIYIMGISAGAVGALDAAIRDPKSFAAVVSICGAVSPARMKALKKVPVRLYHGTMDETIPVDYSRDAYYELKALGSDEVEIIEYSGTGHECWREAMSSSDYLKWVFSKSR